jgi:hypothetical protein
MLRIGSIGAQRWALIAGALAGMTALAPVALTQQPQAGGRVPLGELFGEDSAELKPDKARALADAVLQALRRQGIDASRFSVDSSVRGAKHDSWLDHDLDRQRPRLHTTSVPPRGTKVKAGDLIKVTMVARDDADPKLWQRGIKTIQFVAESEGGRFVASENYEPCAGVVERRVEATYTVPSNPPPVVRLSALAEDHAGLMDNDVGEFPTGIVWAGTIKLERDGRVGECSVIRSETEFEIAVADNGDVSGVGTLNHSSYTCPGGYTAPAVRAPVAIGGKKQGGTFTLFLSDWPKTALLPRLPVGQWTVEVGQGSTGEGTLDSGGMTDVVFRAKLECRTCGRP